MKKICIIAMMLAVAQFAIAQVTLQPVIPAVGLIQKNQLWNVLVINSTNQTYDCRMALVLQERITGQEVLTATTASFRVSPGALQLNANAANPVQYNYMIAGMDNRLQGLIPTGNYMACYTLTSRSVPSLAEECTQFDTEPLSPPALIFPADSTMLENASPQFSWMPPTPDGMFNNLRYEIVITEINNTQKANEAIQENIPVYSNGSLYTNFLNYPLSAKVFDKDKWYAWQVIARDGRGYAGKSETWVFKINMRPAAILITKQVPFIKMKKNDLEKGIAADGILKISYINEAADSVATIKIIDLKNQQKVVQQFNIALRPGENLIKYDLKEMSQLQDKKLYEAQIINSRQEKWGTQFEIHYNTEKNNKPY